MAYTSLLVSLPLRSLVCVVLVLCIAVPIDAQQAPSDPLAQASDALHHGRYREAEEALRRLDSGAARVALARLLIETGRYEEADAVASRAATDRTQSIAAATALGEARLRRGQLDRAEEALRQLANERDAHRARVLLGEIALRTGRDAEARQVLMQVIAAFNNGTIGARDAEGLAHVGMAAAMLGSAHDANDAFRDSTRVMPDRVETQLEWAALFLSHYDSGHAEECLRDALRINPESPRGHALMARLMLERSLDFAGADSELDRALAGNPNLVIAHVTRAAMALRDMDLVQAESHIASALAIDPGDLEALSVRAAIRFLAGDQTDFRTAVRAVLDRNPRYSEVYSIVAEHADWEHRYPDVVALARQALTIDPLDARAHATLGINLLRMGQEAEGVAALRQAWRRDRFNVRVFNMLNLWDDVIVPHYETIDAGPLRLRMHRDERPILEPLATSTLRAAWEGMRRRYHFTPTGPVWIEMFASDRHFSVRTSGLPNAGVQGVCFGQVVTALSPRGGPFDWAEITTHELAHVFHIQLSRNRVPRWFTEGLAVHETETARPEWHNEEDHFLYRALDGGRIPHIRDLNSAFTHARRMDDMRTAYYASSKLVAYIDQRFGFDRVVAMLRGWGEGRNTPDVIQRALGISIDDLDRDWRAHERSRLAARATDFSVDFARYLDLDAIRAQASAAPSSAAAQAALAAALMQGDASGATQAAREALRIDPHEPIAHFVMARLAIDRRAAPEAESHLADLITHGHDGYEVRLLGARAAFGRSDQARARIELEAAASVDADRVEAWQGLLQIGQASQDAELQLRALRRLVAIDQHDRESLALLLDELQRRREWAELLAIAPRTLFTDPERARGRYLLAEAYLHAGRAREALAEYDAALLAHIEETGPIHLGRAQALTALHRATDAARAAEAAIAADPSLAEQAAEIGRHR